MADHPRSHVVQSSIKRSLAFTAAAVGLVLAYTGGASALEGHCGCGSSASIPTAAEPAWSPDGRRIAFSRSDDSTALYVMNVDGTREHAIVRMDASQYDPDWSPDGTRIAFAGYGGENLDIYVANADGTGVLRLTSSGGYDGDPDWSPDG